MGLALQQFLLYDGFFLNQTSPNTEFVTNYAKPGGFLPYNER